MAKFKGRCGDFSQVPSAYSCKCGTEELLVNILYQLPLQMFSPSGFAFSFSLQSFFFFSEKNILNFKEPPLTNNHFVDMSLVIQLKGHCSTPDHLSFF